MKAAKHTRVSDLCLHELRRVGAAQDCDTTWLCVLKSGLGRDAWRTALQRNGFVVAQAPSASEGDYILIPQGTTPEEMVHAMIQINKKIRLSTYFGMMNRTNKSRVHFKYEPFTVSLMGNDKPILVQTTRFSRCALQLGDFPKVTARLEEGNSSSRSDEGRDDRNEHNERTSGSLSLESLAEMEPLLEQKPRNEYEFEFFE